MQGTDPSGEHTLTRKPLPSEPFAALLFKITAQAAADLFYLRVYSGSLKAGTRVVNARNGRKDRLRRMLRMHADRGEPVERIEAGDIVAVAGLRECVTGDTLCDEKDLCLLEPIRFPETVVSVAVEPKTNADRDRFEEILGRMRREDPTLGIRVDSETGQTLLSGMGELHLEVVLDRLDRDFNLKIQQGKPRVSYREAVAGPGQGKAEYRRTVAGDNLFAEVAVAVEPLESPGVPVVVEDGTEPGSVPKQYVPELLDSLRNAADGGGLYGYPMFGTRLVVKSARYDDVGQPEIALNSATSMAFREAVKTAGTLVLEPYGRLEVRVPEDFLGGVVKSLNQRRALVEDTGFAGSMVLIRGVVPIAEMFGYLTILRSQTQGRGSFSLEPTGFRPVPETLAASEHERLF